MPFFRVPPTTDYHLIAEEHIRQHIRRQRVVTALFTVLVVLAATIIGFLTVKQYQVQQIAAIKKFPKVRFYYYDFPEFPALSRKEKSQTTYIAIQAFEDHFGLKIDEYEILHGEVPAQLSFLGTGYFSELSSFAFWDERVFEKDMANWLGRERAGLDVLISNFPIYLGDSQKIESRHLNSEKLISGLGHPSLVLASSYRLLNQLKITDSTERARHLGEYVMAHELGHGLLGIPDYVIKDEPRFMRGPASLDARDTSPLTQHCLMHTDAGGGALAWNQIRQRKLGDEVACTAYENMLSAAKLRENAIELAKAGQLREASDELTLAIAQISSQPEFAKSWIRALWQKELRAMKPSLW